MCKDNIGIDEKLFTSNCETCNRSPVGRVLKRNIHTLKEIYWEQKEKVIWFTRGFEPERLDLVKKGIKEFKKEGFSLLSMKTWEADLAWISYSIPRSLYRKPGDIHVRLLHFYILILFEAIIYAHTHSFKGSDGTFSVRRERGYDNWRLSWDKQICQAVVSYIL